MTGSMQKLMILSRCPQSNLSFNRKLEDDYNIHKKKIQQIMHRERIKHSESNPYLQMIRKSKEANTRIGSEFSSTKQQNQILLGKLSNISRRKFYSVSNINRELHLHNDDEQKRVKQENIILFKKLEDQKKTALSKDDIKKEIKDYLLLRKNLRKVKKSDSSKK